MNKYNLLLSSPTQLYFYNIINRKLIKTIDCKHFNDVHNIIHNNENLLISNTGLDSVIEMSFNGDIKNIWSSNEVPVWDKFNKDVDYRLIASTKPHVNHPNFAFYMNGEPWTTRFHDKDAINLLNKDMKIKIDVGKPHDGHVIDDKIYFTTINGFVVTADVNSLECIDVFDLNSVDTRNTDLGWCRGLAISGDFAYVGFTRLRQTKLESNVKWLKSKLDNSSVRLPSRIAKYNLKTRVLIDEFEIPEGKTDLIFSILLVE